MKSLLLAICILGLLASLQASRMPYPLYSNRDLSGNECYNHQHGDLIPYPGDCTKYLVCEYFAGTVMQCPSGLHFNPVLKVCDWPTAAGCNQEGGPPTQSPSTPTKEPATPPSTEEPTTTTTQAPSAEPPTTTTTEAPPTEPPITTSTDAPDTPPTEQPITTTTEAPDTSPTEPPTTISTKAPDTPPTEEIPTLSPDDNICIGKANGSLYPYPHNCDWYIRCEYCLPVVNRCEQGKQFNAILRICDFPENAQCTATPYPTTTTSEPSTTPISSTTEPVSDPTSGPAYKYCINQPNNTLLPYPWDCGYYIRCEEDNGFVEPCPNGTIFNSVLGICDFIYNTECKEIPFQPSTIPTPSTTTIAPGQGATNPPYIGTGICENAERGTLLPYPGRCDLYIVCIEPAPTAISCSAGLEFNPESGNCQEPQHAGCSIPKVTPEVPTSTIVPTFSGICTKFPIGDLIPYPKNCSQYISCELPVPIALECPKDLEFNAELKLCESAQDAGCSCPPAQPPVTSEAPTSTSIPSIPSEGNGVCGGQDEGAIVGYPGDCSKFIVCEQPIPVAHKCEDGLVFNADLGICDEPTTSECEIPTLPPSTESPNDPEMTGICKGHKNGDLLAYPGSCNKYIRCSIPAPIVETCKEDLVFNKILGICDTESEDCPDAIPTPTPGEGSTETPNPSFPTAGICGDHQLGDLIPYPGNCSKFIQCMNLVSYARTCQNGLHFNAKLLICDDPETAKCEKVIPTPEPPSSGSNICCGAVNGTIIPYPEDCTQYIQCIYPIPIALQCNEGLHYNATSQTCQSIESARCQWYTLTTTAPATCEDKEDGTLLPYIEDCKKYYFCSNGELVLLPCTIGSIFNPESGKCIPGDVCP